MHDSRRLHDKQGFRRNPQNRCCRRHPSDLPPDLPRQRTNVGQHFRFRPERGVEDGSSWVATARILSISLLVARKTGQHFRLRLSVTSRLVSICGFASASPLDWAAFAVSPASTARKFLCMTIIPTIAPPATGETANRVHRQLPDAGSIANPVHRPPFATGAIANHVHHRPSRRAQSQIVSTMHLPSNKKGGRSSDGSRPPSRVANWCGRKDLNLHGGCPPEPKSGASASSATPAHMRLPASRPPRGFSPPPASRAVSTALHRSKHLARPQPPTRATVARDHARASTHVAKHQQQKLSLRAG